MSEHTDGAAARSATGQPVKDWLPGLAQNWKYDVVAGLIIFLIALPLSLGIALASGAPPIAGIISAIISGMLVSLLSGSHVTINGPAAGLIVIVLGAVTELGAGDMAAGFRCALAVGVVCGAIQIGLGLLKAGRLTDFFPLSVVHGMLAGIGVIIMVKQIFLALGATAPKVGMVHLIESIPGGFVHLNPAIALIGLISVLIMILWPKWKIGLTKAVPAPLVATIIAVGLGYVFDLSHKHDYTFLGRTYSVGPTYLVQGLPHTLSTWFTLPDFSKITSDVSIRFIVMYVFVASLESLLTAAAVDKLDPFGRRSDMNRELIGKGIGNMLSSAIGGLPMIAEVVRSKANIMSGARTRWANFFHGLFLLVFVALAPSLLEMIPLAALAGILVVIGYRLANPGDFVHAWKLGKEEFIAMVVTILLVVGQDLLVGVATGVVVGLIITLFRGSRLELFQDASGAYVLKCHGPLTFANFVGVRKKLDSVPKGSRVVLDFTECSLVDHTAVERLHDFEVEFTRNGGQVERLGLERLVSSTADPFSAQFVATKPQDLSRPVAHFDGAVAHSPAPKPPTPTRTP
ncbi:MAG TPA: SulP family inorganic anion transporter [Isosphaeraceae bacterium]|nr:SulP family inorganic anion transporter [Isosphaeraceae bacterium]